MSLDVFNPIASDQNVVQNAAHDLPAGFSEAFDISLRGIGEWNSSTAYSNARDRALATYYDDVKRQTGVQLPLYGMGGNVSIDELNEGIAKLPQAPDQAPMPPLSEDSINSMALARMAKAHQDSRAFEHRETTWGGTAGTVIGTLTASLADPVAAATLPLGGAGTVPIAVRALEFAAIGAGTEAAIAASNYQAREAAVPGSSKEIPGEIISAGLFGGALGGAMGALEKVVGHGVRPLPTTVRDEVNAAASELQFHASNPFPTAAGEAAARDATVDATMALIRDLPVRSADNFAASHVADYALAAKATTPEELAIAGEKHLRPGTFDEVPNVERFDAMPHEAEDAGSYWERRLETATPEERAALGATDAGPKAAFKSSYTPPDPLDLAMSGQLNAETAQSAADGVKQYYKDVETHIFGNRADEWNKLNRAADRASVNMNDKLNAELRAKQSKLEDEIGLTPEHEDLLGGAGLPDTYDPDFWKNLRDHLNEIELGREDALHSVAHQVRYLPTTRNWDQMNNSQRESLLVIFSALNAEKAAGRDPAKFLKEAFEERMARYGGGADAREVVGHQMEELAALMGGAIERDAAPTAKAAQREQMLLSPPRDLNPEQVAQLAAEPATQDAVLHNLDHIIAANPEAEFTTQVRQADGTYQFQTQKLSDVMKEIGEFESAARELEACVVGLEAAE